MTTLREIGKLVRPLVERHPAMVHSRHMLVVRPVRHVMRVLMFWGSSNRLDPNPGWMLAPLFFAPGLISTFGRHIPVGRSDWPGFQQVFEERTNEGIERYLLPHETIDEFYALALQPGVFMLSDLSRMHCERGTMLAALGRFDEAMEVLAGSVAELERQAVAEIARGQALLAKRSNSGVGKQDVEFGERKRKLAGELHRLLRCLGARDTAATAALLHEWERLNVAKWEIGEHWEETPFPFETAAARDL